MLNKKIRFPFLHQYKPSRKHHPRAYEHRKPNPENHERLVNTELFHGYADEGVADEIKQSDGAST